MIMLTTGRHHSVSLEEFLENRIPGVTPRDVFSFRSADEVPSALYERMFRDTLDQHYDVYTPLERGKEWLFELTLEDQPRTGKLLLDGGPLIVRATPGPDYRKDRWDLQTVLGLEVQGKFVGVNRRFWGSNPSDVEGREDPDSWVGDDFYRSLPPPLARAYYNRFDGLDLPWPPSFSNKTWMLPRQMGGDWVSLDHFLTDRYRGYKARYMPWFDERFPHLKPKRRSDPYYGFRCFLEALPCDMTRKKHDVLRSGIDSLWVEIDAKEPLVYLVTDGKLDEMRVLADPVEAVDRYCEHVLLNRLEPFDFHQFSRPLD